MAGKLCQHDALGESKGRKYSVADKHSGALVVDENNEVDADSPSNPEKIKPDIGTVAQGVHILGGLGNACLLYTSPSPRDLSTSRMPSSA